MEDNDEIVEEKKTWKKDRETLKENGIRRPVRDDQMKMKLSNDEGDTEVITGTDTFFLTEAYIRQDELNQLDEMEPDAEESSGRMKIEVGRIPRSPRTKLEAAQQQELISPENSCKNEVKVDNIPIDLGEEIANDEQKPSKSSLGSDFEDGKYMVEEFCFAEVFYGYDFCFKDEIKKSGRISI